MFGSLNGFCAFVVKNLGGMISLAVMSKNLDTVKCKVIDGGELKSRRHLNVRGKSATLPSITGIFSCTGHGYVFLLPLFFLIKWILLIFKMSELSFSMLLTEKDWEDIKFGVANKIDFYAVSFVKDAKVVHELKDYLKSKYLLCFSPV